MRFVIRHKTLSDSKSPSLSAPVAPDRIRQCGKTMPDCGWEPVLEVGRETVETLQPANSRPVEKQGYL